MSPILGRTDHAARTLPIASRSVVVAHARALAREHRGALVRVLAWHGTAALVALVGPWVVGQIVQELTHTERGTGRIDLLVTALAVGIVAQTVLTWFARRASFVLAEQVFARLREDFVTSAVRLPLSVVERAGTGDLVARTTNDIDALSRVIRFGIPVFVVSVMTVAATAVAAILTSPLAALALPLAALVQVPSTRWYLRRAGDGYLWEHASYARLNAVAAETVEGARTMDALGLQRARGRRFDEALAESWRAEQYTLGLRLWWFPWLEIGFFLPVAGAVLWGGWLAYTGHISVAAATTVTLYTQQALDPLGELISWLDEIQFAATSLSRILGVAEVPPDRTATGALPVANDLDVDEVRYAYREGRDVLHGVSLDLRPGERLAIVGPSGAGKSTLGRLMAGIDGPRRGRITVGGVPLVDLELPVLRGEVALVTQEHHVFVGTLRDNLLLARPGADDAVLLDALAAVDAAAWARALPQGLDTMVGSGGHVLAEGQGQQLALARLVLADPHTLVLDEATSLLDPRAARHLERSLAAVVDGRTVVAIAHRLHTAHDADRVAVVEDGLISELGSHHELLAANGPYAALWRSWRDERDDEVGELEPGQPVR
jgi:ABC-type multidrug transport system fused ATPase/permease subunit